MGQQQQQQKVCRALSIAPDDDKVKEFVPPEAIRQPSLDHLSEHIWKYSKSPLASSFCCREEMPIRNCKSTARRKEQQHKNAECPPIFRTELTTISGPKKFKCWAHFAHFFRNFKFSKKKKRGMCRRDLLATLAFLMRCNETVSLENVWL